MGGTGLVRDKRGVSHHHCVSWGGEVPRGRYNRMGGQKLEKNKVVKNGISGGTKGKNN